MTIFSPLFDRMTTRATAAAASAALLGLFASACAVPATGPSIPDTATIGASLQLCSDEINRYRASVGLPALSRSTSLEQFAADAAQHDTAAGVPHTLFRQTNGGGVAMAETELLLWSNRAVQDVIKLGLSEMWNQGPAGEHYSILAGPYTQVGCGVFVTGGVVSVAQDYK